MPSRLHWYKRGYCVNRAGTGRGNFDVADISESPSRPRRPRILNVKPYDKISRRLQKVVQSYYYMHDKTGAMRYTSCFGTGVPYAMAPGGTPVW